MKTDEYQQIPLVIGVTGHRDLIDAEKPQLRKKVEAFIGSLRSHFPDLPLLFLTGLAEGADRLVAEVAADFDCQLINVLPMPQTLYELDFEAAGLQEFRRIVGLHRTVELPLLADSQAETVASYGDQRDLQYERLGAFLAAHSHILLALWDGKYNRAVGGTGQVIDFHQRDISALADDQVRSQLDIADDESDLVYHVVCSRQSTGRPADNLEPCSASWFTRDDVTPRAAELPKRYVDVFKIMQIFNRDVRKLSNKAALYDLDPVSVAGHAEEACNSIRQIYGASDTLASHYQKRVLWALRTTLVATVLAGLCFIVYADFNDQQNFIWGYFLFVGLGLGSYWLAQNRDWQRRYLDYRVLAEGLRVQFYWALGGVEMRNPSRYSHDSFFQGRDLQLGWIRNVMRVTGLYADADFEPTDEELESAINGWVGGNDSGQLGYYRRKAGDKLRKHQQTSWVTVAAFMLGLTAAGVLALGSTYLQGSTANWLVAMMGLLPIVAASRQNYAHRVAERELAAQYNHMLSVFENAHRLLQQTENASAQQSILRDLGEAALNENAQWVLRQRERPLPGSDAAA
ncbi:MAG: hypothetical protein ACI9UU_003432 [Candidatus Azotimanducaceae bacterium]|jgi:hypothetical protein